MQRTWQQWSQARTTRAKANIKRRKQHARAKDKWDRVRRAQRGNERRAQSNWGNEKRVQRGKERKAQRGKERKAQRA
jgi:hypothetical protein